MKNHLDLEAEEQGDRDALGASRARLFILVFEESEILATIGAALGIANVRYFRDPLRTHSRLASLPHPSARIAQIGHRN